MLSKKYYKEIGYLLDINEASDTLINAFEKYFKEDNEHFNTNRFEQFLKKIKGD